MQVAKTEVICVMFLSDVARQKLLKSANAAWNYSKNKSGTFLQTTAYNNVFNHLKILRFIKLLLLNFSIKVTSITDSRIL